jgi:hypothetical protein
LPTANSQPTEALVLVADGRFAEQLHTVARYDRHETSRARWFGAVFADKRFFTAVFAAFDGFRSAGVVAARLRRAGGSRLSAPRRCCALPAASLFACGWFAFRLFAFGLPAAVAGRLRPGRVLVSTAF